MRRAGLVAATSVALALALGAWWWVQTSPAPPKHVLIVSMDTFRADHVGAMGLMDVHTPALDALASEGLLFTDHTSAAPTTLASHTALFTGLYPHTHGVPRNDYIVSDDNVLLAEVLSDNGFETAAFLGAMPLASHSNVLQGFDHIDEDFDVHRGKDGVDQTQRDGQQVTDAALAWLDSKDLTAGGARAFVFVHYFDAHAPYNTAPPEFYAAVGADPRRKNLGSMGHIVRTQRAIRGGGGAKGSAELRLRYQAGAQYVDHQVGRLIDGLRSRGVLQDTLVLITADHGETFETHLEEPFDHGATLFQDTVHTPLIVRHPNAALGGRTVDVPVSNVDITPTLLDWLGLDRGEAPRAYDGVSLVPLLTGGSLPTPRGPVFTEATKPHEPGRTGWHNALMKKAIRDGDLKLVHDPRRRQNELYDLAQDPTESANQVHDRLPDRDVLLPVLKDWMSSADPMDSQRTSKSRVRAELAALGYVDEDDTTATDDSDDTTAAEDSDQPAE